MGRWVSGSEGSWLLLYIRAVSDAATGAEVEDMILQLFELVNEKNELFRKQAELMYL